MFDNLVESNSHAGDIKRKGSFFLGAMALYGVLIVGLAIGSILLYDAHLENQNLELVTLVAPVPVQAAPEPEAPKPAESQPKPTTQEVATRTEFVARVDQLTKEPPQVSAVASKVPPIPKGVPVRLGTSDTDVARVSGPVGPTGTGGGVVGGTGTSPIVNTGDEPPPPPKPTPAPKRAPVSGGVLNGKAVSKPNPTYPPIAKAARASGTVVVQITVDESGKVVSARAVSGHPLLQQAATQAAYQTRFSPTMLSGQPVKVTGTISFNFVLQ